MLHQSVTVHLYTSPEIYLERKSQDLDYGFDSHLRLEIFSFETNLKTCIQVAYIGLINKYTCQKLE